MQEFRDRAANLKAGVTVILASGSRLILLLTLLLMSLACDEPAPIGDWTSESLRIVVDESGRISALESIKDGRNHMRAAAHLLTLRKGDRVLRPTAARLRDTGIELSYPDSARALVSVRTQTTHISLELVSLTEADSYDLAIWGPFPTDLDEVIGETVGVVQGETFALGIQTLNTRTLGGYPWRDTDTMPGQSVPLAQPTAWGDTEVRYRNEAASPDEPGSSLQAYVRNRSRERIVPNRGYEQMVIPPIDDEGLVGTAIALFGVDRSRALETIGRIELAEGLPHPTLEGEWVKTARSALGAYMVLEFDEERLDLSLDAMNRSGLKFLYHEEPFSTWGEFTLDPQYFPDGQASLERMVTRAEERGVSLGLHTLTNFVTPNDPVVTPIPSEGLSMVGSTVLVYPVSADGGDLVLEDTTYFINRRKSHLRAAKLEQELITFDSVSTGPPWSLMGVERGAFGTQAVPHDAGATISKLDDHAYKVFLADMDLSLSMARGIAKLMRETGVKQIGFDGLGGVQTSGHGKYAEILFVDEWYRNLGTELQGHTINSASGTSHYYWHIYTRMNWGEPWRGGFREAQLVRRLRQQDYYRRNFMHPMLGWFKMVPETSVADVEWMLARAAAFDAGYCFVTNYETLEANGQTDKIMDRIRVWEEARLAGVFPEILRKEMEDVEGEYFLESVPDSSWKLYPVTAKELTKAGDGAMTYEVDAGETVHSISLLAGPAGLGPLELYVDDVLLAGPVGARPGHRIRVEPGGVLVRYSPTWEITGQEEFEQHAILDAPGPKVLSWKALTPRAAGPDSVSVRYRQAPTALSRNE